MAAEFQYPEGVSDYDFYDLQTYLEGGAAEARAAAQRLDRRAVANGQMSSETYARAWGEKP